VIEDDDLVAKYIVRELSYVYRVERVTTAAEGKSYLAKNKVDAVLLDLGLPNGFGLSLVREFTTRFPTIPLVVITGFYFDDEEILESGAQEFIWKGNLSPQCVLDAISRAIARHRHRVQLFSVVDQDLKQINESINRTITQIEDSVAETKLADSSPGRKTVKIDRPT